MIKRCPECLRYYTGAFWQRWCSRACREADPMNQKPKSPQLELPNTTK